MKNFLNRVGLLIICIIEIAVGVIIVFNPEKIARTAILVAGIGLLVYGVISVISYIRTEPLIAATGLKLFKGLAALAAGLYFVFDSRSAYEMISVYSEVFGLILLLLGIYKIQSAVDMLRLRLRFWYVALVSAALSLIFAMVIFADPFRVPETLWLFIGVCVIVEGISDFITFLVGRITDRIEDEIEKEIAAEQ